MSQVSTITQTERALYATYETQRRRRLLSAIIPPGILITALAFGVAAISLLFNPNQNLTVWLNDGLTLLLALLFGAAWLALRRNAIALASAILISAGGLGVVATVGTSSFIQGLNPLSLVQLAALNIVIVLVGMVGDVRSIAGATLLLNAVTVAIILCAPHDPALDTLIAAQRPLMISVSLTYQWAVAVFMIAIWLTYRQTLQALGQAYERAQQLDLLKNQFITHVNHELRTPIMTLQGYIEYLRLSDDIAADKARSTLDKASLVGDQIVTLLSNILDVRRIDDAQSFQPEAVPVLAALEAAMLLVDPRAGNGQDRDVQVSIPAEIAVWGEPVRVQQILANLLANAVKYSPPASMIEVRVAETLEKPPRAGDAARRMIDITVRDYGLGVPPEQAALLFNRFARLPRDLASAVHGTGLGLYLCRVFTEAMGGRIWVTSSGVAGEGSSFTVRLPAAVTP